MIIDGNKRPLPDDPTPNEAPPSYDTLVQINPPPQVSDLKHTYSTGSSSNRPVQGSSSRSNVGASAYSTPSTSKAPARNWFTSLMGSKTEKDVKATVVGLVRDLVREHYSDSAAPAGILQSCAAACEAHSLDLSKLLQEKSIEGHTPLYWAIVKRKPDEDVDEFTQIPDLLIALLSHATPLTDETIMEIRHACLITSDQKLFQRLRMSPEFAKVSGADQMLLGVTLPNDEIEVEEIPGEDGDIAVTFIVPQFQKRMMVTQHIVLEFIARCRMWKLSFDIAVHDPHRWNSPKTGSWTLSLSLQDNSPPTWIDAHIIIPEPADTTGTEPLVMLSPVPQKSLPPTPSLLTAASSAFNLSPREPPKSPSRRPPIDLRLPCRERLTCPTPKHHSRGYQIVVCLEDHPTAATLQYAGNPYIASDEKLRFRLEARLRQPSNREDCVIC